MNNTDDSANDKEQLETVPMDYRALLAMTRPLVIREDAPLLLRGGEISRSGFGIWLEPADYRKEFAVRKGEIIRSEGESDVAGESISALGETGSNLKLRICLNMS
jgi:hypothetical protein